MGASVKKRVVVVHQGALGDFLLTVGVLDGLYEACPSVRFDFWSKREHVALIAGKPYTGDVHPCGGPELSSLYHDTLWVNSPIPHFFFNADTIFVFGQNSARLLAQRLSERVECPVHWLRSFPGPEENEPVANFLVRQLQSLGWPVRDVVPDIEPAADETAEARQWLEQRWWADCRPVFIHPGSGGRRKIWPLARWWGLLQWLRNDARLPVLLAAGAADAHLRQFMDQTKTLGVELLEGLSLPRLAAFLAQSRLYIGNDSGVSHLAALVGAPTLAIFGPSSPETWAPRGRRVYVVRSSWDEGEIFDWSPCSLGVPVEPVVREAVEGLKNGSRRGSPADGGFAAAPDPTRTG